MSIQDKLRKIKEQKNGKPEQPADAKPAKTFAKKKATPEGVETKEVRPAQLSGKAIREADEARQEGNDVDAGDVFGAVPDEADCLELEEPPSPAKPPRKSTLEEPLEELSLSDSAVRSVHSAPALGDKKVTHPESGVYDETQAHGIRTPESPKPPPLPNKSDVASDQVSEVEAFINGIVASRASVDEKVERVNVFLKKLYTPLANKFGKDGLEKFAAQANATPVENRTPLMHHVLDVVKLAQLKKELAGLKKVVDRELVQKEQAEKVRSLKRDLAEQNGMPQEASGQDIPEAGATAAQSPKALVVEPEAPAATVNLQFTDERPEQSSLSIPSEPVLLQQPVTRKKSPIAAFFSSRYTWGIGLMAGWGTTMWLTDGFQQLTRAVNWFSNSVLNQPIDISMNIMKGVCAGLIVTIIGVTEVLRRGKAKKEAALLQTRAESDKRFTNQRTYVVEKLSEILMAHKDVDSQRVAIREAMAKNEKLLAYLDLFKDETYMLERVFEDVRG